MTERLDAAVPRVEDARFLTGRGAYIGNVRAVRPLHMVIARSPHAHAALGRVDAARARAVPGVVGVFSAADLGTALPPLPHALVPGVGIPDHHPLAVDRVRFVGEPVVVVVAETPESAADARDLLDVDYELLPPVLDAFLAAAGEGPVLHPELGTNTAFAMSTGPSPALLDAEVVVEARLANRRVIACALEPRGVLADVDPSSGTLVLHTSTQAPHLVRTTLAAVVGIPEHRIRVVAGDVGGAFGSKLNVYPEDVLAVVLSRRLGRPVRWIEERSEAMVGSCHGRGLVADVRAGASADGVITALHLDVVADVGAYAGLVPPLGALLTCAMASGSYRIPAITFDARVVYTNKTPVEPYRGYYRAEASYFVERIVDVLAGRLGLDPAEVRRRNLIRSHEFPYRTATGEVYDGADHEAALGQALAAVDYDRARAEQRRLREEGRYLGIGLATFTWRAAFPSKGMGASRAQQFLPGGWEAATLRVERSGGVTVRTGASPHGQGLANALMTIVSESLGVPRGDVTVVHGDTDTTPYGIGSEGSRALVTAGSAVHTAAARVKGKATDLAAHLLEAAAEDLVWDSDRVAVNGVPSRSFSLYELAGMASQGADRPSGMEPGLEAAAAFDPEDFTYPSGAHVCVVEVDPDTGRVEVLRYVAVDDCGRRISPRIVEGQIHGAIAQGIAQALLEEAIYDDAGQLLTGNFLTYAIPSAAELPSFTTLALETLTDRNPLGAKGAGEAGTIGAPPAVVNAVVDALTPFGVTHLDMPLTPEVVWRAMHPNRPRRLTIRA